VRSGRDQGVAKSGEEKATRSGKACARAIFSRVIFPQREKKGAPPSPLAFLRPPSRSGRLKKEILRRGSEGDIAGGWQTFWHPHVEFFHAAYHRRSTVKYELRYFGL
jgi:hypothetical protein